MPFPLLPTQMLAGLAVALCAATLPSGPATAAHPTITLLSVQPELGLPGRSSIGEKLQVDVIIADKTLLEQAYATPSPGSGVAPGMVAAGGNHSCAVTGNGNVACWGDSLNDNFGQSNMPPAASTYKWISAGYLHTCAVTANNKAECWGAGLVVDGESSHQGQSKPPVDLGDIRSITAGGFHSCAVKTSDLVTCWGNNVFGQRDVPPLPFATAVTSGLLHSCLLKPNKSIACWGAGKGSDPPTEGLHYGQSNVPAGLVATAVTAGLYHTCAIRDPEGTVTCWGRNNSGQNNVPLDLGPVLAVSAGGFHTCAIRTDATVACWGQALHAVTEAPATLKATAISAGLAHTCALTPEGAISCWGYDSGAVIPRALTSQAVTLFDGATVLDHIQISHGGGVLSAESLPAGRYAFSIGFAGDMNYLPSSSSPVLHLVTGTNSGETLRGTGTGDTLYGMGGDDVIIGLGGNDLLDGGDGHDRISGGAGDDRILGGRGRDVIEGGAGKDRMTGGPGADTFVFRRPSNSPAGRPDVITDFNVGQGDKIDLSKFDGNARQRGKQRFTEYLGTRAFTRKPGQLRFDRTRNRLEGDTSGDGRANFRVVLLGVTRLPARALKLR